VLNTALVFMEISLFAGTGTYDLQHILRRIRYRRLSALARQFCYLVLRNQGYRAYDCLIRKKALLERIRYSSFQRSILTNKGVPC